MEIPKELEEVLCKKALQLNAYYVNYSKDSDLRDRICEYQSERYGNWRYICVYQKATIYELAKSTIDSRAESENTDFILIPTPECGSYKWCIWKQVD